MFKLNENIERASESKSKSIAMLILGPILGLIYFVSMPLVVIGAVVVMVVDRMIKGVMHLVFFGWRPQESYLGGKKKPKKEDRK